MPRDIEPIAQDHDAQYSTRSTPEGISMNTPSAPHTRVARLKELVVLVAVAVFLTSCATVGDRARLEGTLGGAGIGAAVGGAVGAIGGAILGDTGLGAAIGAAVGAAIGGIGGFVYADQIDKRHAALSGKEHDLDARIAFARGVNQDTEKCNRLLKDEVTKLDSRIADVEARIKQGTITQEKQAKAKQVLTEKIKDANQQLTLVDNELQGLKEIRAQQ